MIKSPASSIPTRSGLFSRHPRSALYGADIKAPALHRDDPATGDRQSWMLIEDIGAFAPDGVGNALVALRRGRYWLDLATGAPTLAAAAPFDPKLIRFNEGACDSSGRFWVGTMTHPPPGHQSEQKGLLHVFSAHGLVPVADIAFIKNGKPWDGAERHFYRRRPSTVCGPWRWPAAPRCAGRPPGSCGDDAGKPADHALLRRTGPGGFICHQRA